MADVRIIGTLYMFTKDDCTGYKIMSSDSAWRLGYERGILDGYESILGTWDHFGALHCVHRALRRSLLHLH